MKSKLVLIVLFYFILNYQFNAQSNNNSTELIKPYKIEINDDDSSIFTFDSENFNYTFPDLTTGNYPICLTITRDLGC